LGGEELQSMINTIYAQRLTNFAEYKKNKELVYGAHINGTYDIKVQGIQNERERVICILNSPAKQREYRSEDIEDYLYFIDRVIMHLKDVYHISDEEMFQYEEMARKGEDPQSLPYHNDVLEVNPMVIT